MARRCPDFVVAEQIFVDKGAQRIGVADGRDAADDDLERLAFCIAGLAVHLHVGHELIDQLTARGWPVLLTAAPDPAELAMLADIQARLSRPVASSSSGR